MNSRRVFLSIIAVALALSLSPLEAELKGRRVTVTGGTQNGGVAFGPLIPEVTVVVGDTVEFPEIQAQQGFVFAVPIAIDLLDDSITFDFSKLGAGAFLVADFNGYILKDTEDMIPPFTAVSIDPAVTTLGITNDRITVDDDRITLNVSGLPYDSTSFAKLDLEFEVTKVPSLEISHDPKAGMVTLSWEGEWVLQTSSDFKDWEDVRGAESPLVTDSSSSSFWRLRKP